MSVVDLAYKRGAQRFIAAMCLSLCLTATPAFAQKSSDDSSVAQIQNGKTSERSEGLNFNLPAAPSLETQTGPRLELPLDVVGSTALELDLSSQSCSAGGEGCLTRDGRVDFGVTDTFNRRSEKGLDLKLTPRASMRFGDEVSSAVVGAVIEIGEDLREGSEFENNTWYFFAGADAEALTYSPNSVNRITSGQFHLQDRIIVGDAQAGLGYRMGDADVSLSYMRREASTEEFSFKEDAATLSFTWKR